MRKRDNILAVLLAVSALVVMPLTSVAKEIRVATGEYPPFTDSSGANGGLVNSFISQIANNAGMSVAFDYQPWKRSLELTRVGRFDATSFWYFSPEREKDFIHVGPIMKDRLVFFRRADTPEPKWNELADLTGLKIGAVSSYTYTPEFWQLKEDGVLNVELAPSDEANFKKLLSGRIDLFPMSEESGQQLLASILSEDEKNQIIYSEKTLLITDGFLLVPRAIEDAEELAARLQSAADELSATAD